MTTTQTTAAKPHADGGTFTTLALANTRDGWAIAITRWTTYRNTVVFEVHRVSPENKMMRLGTKRTEQAARALANETWLRDR